MIFNFLTRVFGNKNERELRQFASIVESINLLEPKLNSITNYELMEQTDLFRARFNEGEDLDALLPEAFATVREASIRALGLRHYDVQILGGIILHFGKIAEMKTGEGKTLVATLPAYLNAIAGQGVHIVTVNDYLAIRDTKWMGKIYNILGIKVGTLLQGMDKNERKKAYSADITYGTNNEFGFDYLRDNMVFTESDLVQRNLNFSIVDEVDSILIDEARTPLVISGASEKSTNLYGKINSVIHFLDAKSDYKIDEKARSVILTEPGITNVEKILKIKNIYDPSHIEILHHVNQALKAHLLFKKDIDYIIKNREIVIVDEFTGRLMIGRRYSEGLHQAIEAKEGVEIQNENQTFATITFQNYFRMYKKLSGMTGTADTESAEFKKIYDLDVIVIPTNKPMIRSDLPDLIYRTRKQKIKAIINDIENRNKKGQPVLVGTASIDNSEKLSVELNKYGIKHSILNAKNHEKEADIVAMAGQKFNVTISTNMAGRGTDIVLGAGVVNLGGLHIIGTERHESRRIDNQLRGRSGRQGDPGSSRFYLSLEDDLLRIFGGKRITSIMERLGMPEEEPIEHGLITKSIENAQSKVEAHNFDVRKHLLQYDDVLNQQREVVYKQRRNLLEGQNLKPTIEEIISEKIEIIVSKHFNKSKYLLEKGNLQEIFDKVLDQFNFKLKIVNYDYNELTCGHLSEIIYDQVLSYYLKKELILEVDNFRKLERVVMLQLVDGLWKEHLLNMDHLKEGIGLRGYAQQNPLIVYKKEGFNMFQDMISKIRNETVEILFKIKLDDYENIYKLSNQNKQKLCFSNNENGSSYEEPLKRYREKIGRNSPCSCGSGKKYKKCCGK